MNRIVLTRIEFARTILKLGGVCPEEVGENAFILCRECSGEGGTQEEILSIPDAEVSDGKFSIEIATLAVRNDAPLISGEWYLCVVQPDGSRQNVYAADDLYDQIVQYREPETEMNLTVDRGEKDYFHVFSKLREKDFTFYLRVEYQVPEEETRLLKIWQENCRNLKKKWRSSAGKKIFSLAFGFFNKHVQKTGNRVLFTSDSRSEIGGNEEFIYRRMLERGMGEQYEFRFNFKSGLKSRRSLKSKIQFTYYLATSDYIFTDDYQPELYLNDYDPSVKIIQVWHACGAFKTVGFERLKTKGAPDFNTRIHKCYTHVLVSSDLSARHNAEAFAIGRDRFYTTGVPRTDIFFDDQYKKEIRETMFDAFPQARTASRVILYAPTFRGSNNRDAWFPMQALHFDKIGVLLKETGSVMIFKMHPFVRGKIPIPEEYREYFIDASDSREINDILFITDLLITDYSSVIYEASLLNIPMLFYAFDLKSYIADRGFYEPYEKIVPGKIVKTLPALLKAIREDDFEREKLKGFVERNFKYTDGKSTDRAIDLIFGE